MFIFLSPHKHRTIIIAFFKPLSSFSEFIITKSISTAFAKVALKSQSKHNTPFSLFPPFFFCLCSSINCSSTPSSKTSHSPFFTLAQYLTHAHAQFTPLSTFSSISLPQFAPKVSILAAEFLQLRISHGGPDLNWRHRRIRIFAAEMVAEPWLLKMGNQVSHNLKHALYLENLTKSPSAKQGPSDNKQIIGILSFEVANAMSKIIHLHNSLSENEVFKLKNEVLKSEGVRSLVCGDEKHLLELVVEEKLDDLNKVAGVVCRLGKKCTIPALQGFEHVYGDIVCGAVDFREVSFLVRDMEGMVRRMERYVNSTAALYAEMEVMNEMEAAVKKFQHEETRRAYEQKLAWQKQNVRHLRDVSLWNLTYDKVVELLARTVCTVFARLCFVFGDVCSRRGNVDGSTKYVADNKSDGCSHSAISGQVGDERVEKKSPSLGGKLGIRGNQGGLFRAEVYNAACCIGRGRLLMECLSLCSSASKVDDDDERVVYDDRIDQVSESITAATDLNRTIHAIHSGDETETKGSLLSSLKFGRKSRLLAHGPPNSVGASALALHYANVIIVLEKLLRYPHLVGDEARDDLYQMLPTSLRMTLKSSLKSYVKDLAIYDAPLAHAWRERLDLLLKWLAPLAHNMMRWQSERNFEQQQIVTRKNVLLIQTIYFADREKTEAVLSELLVGLNYICRYEQQQNALLDCSSSFDFEECMEWQSQVRSGSFS